MDNQTKEDPNVTGIMENPQKTETKKESTGTDKINEALELLSKEAKGRKAELAQLINEKYSNFKEIMGEALGGKMEKIKEAMATGGERMKDISTGVDRRVHENPWISIGISAASGFLLGYLIGSRYTEE
jgi:ElaB/YqjD/DUF883 family membrane-anchored ribosome-binding protein